MKAQAFLNLVSDMLTAQQNYFKARKVGRLDTHNMLVEARRLEKEVMKGTPPAGVIVPRVTWSSTRPGVPTTMLCCVIDDDAPCAPCSRSRASPKSRMRACRPVPISSVTITFAGFTSRCTTPRAWA